MALGLHELVRDRFHVLTQHLLRYVLLEALLVIGGRETRNGQVLVQILRFIQILHAMASKLKHGMGL